MTTTTSYMLADPVAGRFGDAYATEAEAAAALDAHVAEVLDDEAELLDGLVECGAGDIMPADPDRAIVENLERLRDASPATYRSALRAAAEQRIRDFVRIVTDADDAA